MLSIRTCPFVKRIHDIVHENSEKGYVPHKGWEGNVMGEKYGEVQQRNITEALDKYFAIFGCEGKADN